MRGVIAVGDVLAKGIKILKRLRFLARVTPALGVAFFTGCAGTGSQTPIALNPGAMPQIPAQGPSLLYAVDCCGVFNNGDVNVYTSTLGKVRRIVRGAGDAVTIKLDRTGTLYLLTSGQGFYSGVEVNEWDWGARSPSRKVTGFVWADAIAVDAASKLYVSDCNTCPEGDLLRTQVRDAIYIYRARQTKPWRTITQGLHSPRSIAVDGEGYLYVANVPNDSRKQRPSIAVYAPDSSTPLKVITQEIGGQGLLTADSQNDLFLAVGCCKILEYSQGLGKLLRTITDQVSGPAGLAVDASGTLYVANTSQFPAKGSISVYTPGSVKAAYVVVNGINDPVAVTVSPSGQMYVANDDWGLPGKKGRLTVYPPNAREPLRSIQGGRFGLPTELALDPG